MIYFFLTVVLFKFYYLKKLSALVTMLTQSVKVYCCFARECDFQKFSHPKKKKII